MGNKCGHLADVQSEVPPGYDDASCYEYVSSQPILQKETRGVSHGWGVDDVHLPRLGLAGRTTDGRKPTVQTLQNDLELELPMPPSEWDDEDDDAPLYPLPQPTGDASPIRRPSYFQASSYAMTEAVVRIASRHVMFANSPTHSVHISEFGVQPYSEIYGVHPREFDFDESGDKIPRQPVAHPMHQQAAAQRDYFSGTYPREFGFGECGDKIPRQHVAHPTHRQAAAQRDYYSGTCRGSDVYRGDIYRGYAVHSSDTNEPMFS